MRLRNVKNKAEIMNDSNYLVKDNFAKKYLYDVINIKKETSNPLGC